jgi:4-amino-4-deoxy-L-arabinose transferase-like glycosyltransferase
MESVQRSFWRDGWWVGVYCLILFGFAGFSGRPLTMHEARLPETSREMLLHHEWLLPTSGGRPWLERPPLPHWFVIFAMKLFGHVDRVWIVRLPSALMGTVTVLLTMYMARRWFDPTIGVIAGCVLATSYKFYGYATLAEDDIFLAAMVALAAAFFTQAELSAVGQPRRGWFSFFSNRSWVIWAFFIVLGLSNLAKGPLLGLVILGTPVAVYCFIRAVLDRRLQPVFRYTWLWGWVVLITLTLAWPLWAWHRYPDVLENFKYDYLGRMNGTYAAINEPWWYYPPKLFAGLLPWAPACIFGVYVAWKSARAHRCRDGSLWFLCWALVPLLILSIPAGKHDHYLVPFLAPWAVLGALGVNEIVLRLKSAGHDVLAGRGKIAFAMTFAVLLVVYCVGEAFIAAGTDHTVDDTAFLLRCRNEVPAGAKLFIDGKPGPPGNLDFFRIQFYSRPEAVLLHNLSFLRANTISASVVYVIARQDDKRLLSQLGTVERIDSSPKSHEADEPRKAPVGNFTLYRLALFPGLPRYPVPPYITSLQAMERAPGPWCGPPLQ